MLRGLIFDNSAGLKAVETAPGVFTIQATAGGTPGPHASTHKSGGSDAVKLDELAAPTDVTTLNASASTHGLLPKLDGSASKYLDGSGAWSTPAGGIASAGQPDEVPGSPAAENDEFTSSSLAAKWTEAKTATVLYYGGTAPYTSWSRIKFTGSQYWNLTQSYTSNAGTAFSFTMKFSMPFHASFNSCGLYAYTADDNNAFGASWEFVSAGLGKGAHHRRDSGTWSFGFASGASISAATCFYVHLQRDASNNWQGFISTDGVGWIPCAAAYSKSFNVAKLLLSLNSNATAPTGGFITGGVDWFRVNWLTI